MNGAKALAALGKPKARYALVGEPTGMKPKINKPSPQNDLFREELSNLINVSSTNCKFASALTLQCLIADTRFFYRLLKTGFRPF